MTIELFRADPYCASFDAQVIGLGAGYVSLDQTCFFPQSADQSSDVGRIESLAVLGVRRVGPEIRHMVGTAEKHSLAVGDIVRCQVDWERRYRTMRLHSAQHLLQVGFEATHEAGPQLGGWISPQWASIAFIYASNDQLVEVTALQRWIDMTIDESLLAVHASDQSLDQRRFWHIDGLATLACEGTHVRSTKEIGAVFVSVTVTSSDIIELRAELVAS